MTCFNFWIERRVDEVGPFSCAEICDPGSLEGERWLQPPRLGSQLDPLHPFDPPETTAVGSDQTHRSTVAVGQRLAGGASS